MNDESERRQRVSRAMLDSDLQSMNVKARIPARTMEGPIQSVHVRPLERGYIVKEGDLVAVGDLDQKPEIYEVKRAEKRGSNPIIWYHLERAKGAHDE